MIYLFALILWATANRLNVNANGEIDWECAAAMAVIIPIASHFMNNMSWPHCLLLAVLLMPTNWLYFKISGRMDGIFSFVLTLFPGIIICLLVPAIGATWLIGRFSN